MASRYTPILRWKRGEQVCLRELSSKTKEGLTPCIALRDPDGKNYFKSETELLAQIHRDIGDNPFYLNLPMLDAGSTPTRILKDFALVESLARTHPRAIPVCEIPSIAYAQSVLGAISKFPEEMALRIRPTFDYADAVTLLKLAQSAAARIRPSLHLLVDREVDGTHADPKLPAALGAWSSDKRVQRVVVLAGTVPKSLQIGAHYVDRPDETSFAGLKAASGVSTLSFGDYGVLSPEWREPSGGRGGAPTFYRYTTETKWLLLKDVSGQGQALAQLIVASPAFRGPTYSPGDDAIHRRARKLLGVGNATNHITESLSQHVTFIVNNPP